jgi:hypothetical protein
LYSMKRELTAFAREKSETGETRGRGHRNQRSGVKLISDLRLLTSVINDIYDFYGFYDLRFTAYRLRLDEVNRTR